MCQKRGHTLLSPFWSMSEAMAFTCRMTGWPASWRHTATWTLSPLLEIWIPRSRTFFYSSLVLDLKWIKWKRQGIGYRRLRQNQKQRDEYGSVMKSRPCRRLDRRSEEIDLWESLMERS